MWIIKHRNRVLKKSSQVVCLSHGSIKLLLLWIEVVEKYFFCLRALIFFRNFSEELSRKNEIDLSWECYLNYSLRSQYIFSLIWFNLSFSWWKKKEGKKKKIKKSKKPRSMPFVIFLRGSFAVRDHLQSNLGIISGLGIICGRGLFAALYSTFKLFFFFNHLLISF